MLSNSGETVLGSGTFAKVLRARNLKNGKVVALKCMYKNLLRKQFVMKSRYNADDEEDAAPQMTRSTMLDAVQSELEIMLKLRHINIVRLYYIIDDPTKDQLYLSIEYSAYGQVMDFDGKLLQYVPNQKLLSMNEHIICDCNVSQPWWYQKYMCKDDESERDILREKVERFTERTAKKLFMDCCKGISYLHEMNIIHRDIKPENLLLFADNEHECGLMLKIADFGTAEQFENAQEAILIDTMGTYHFMSPSAIGGDKRNAFFDDIWALGIVLYSFMFGTVPFFHPLGYQLFECIQNDPLQLPSDDVLSASSEVRDLIAKILTKKDADRITLDEIARHPWYEDYVHPEYVIEDSVDLDLTEMESNTCCIVL